MILAKKDTGTSIHKMFQTKQIISRPKTTAVANLKRNGE